MRKLVSLTRSAIDKYNMINEGDRIAIGVSGGKDSLALLCALAELKKFYPKKFDLIAITADPCFNSKQTNYSKVEELCRRLNVPYYIKRTQLVEIIFDIRKEKNPCSLCAKMRRGILHSLANEYGCNKVALGHHYDDAVETFFMNLLNCGSLSCFSPVTYLSRKDIYIIRPLIYCTEREIVNFSTRYNLPVEKSVCPADGNTERQRTKLLIKNLESEYPNLKKKVLGAIERANLSSWHS